ncbi:hypothetical protein KCV04_g17831, partial [Aureobasidium melanogenum]
RPHRITLPPLAPLHTKTRRFLASKHPTIARSWAASQHAGSDSQAYLESLGSSDSADLFRAANDPQTPSTPSPDAGLCYRIMDGHGTINPAALNSTLDNSAYNNRGLKRSRSPAEPADTGTSAANV